MSVLVGLLVTAAVALPSAASVRLARLRRAWARPHATDTPVPTGPRRSGPGELALCLDLLAAALASGQPVGAAVRTVGQALDSALGQALQWVGGALQLGAPVEQAWPELADDDLAAELEVLRGLLGVSLVAGGQAGAVLRAGADAARRRRRRDNEARIARLPVRMVLPLGLCALPAFVAVGVVPVVVSLAENYLR